MNENYEAVQKGFRILNPIASGFIGLEMNRAYHTKWWDEVWVSADTRNLPQSGTYEKLVDSLDIANCLRIIDRRWNEIFKEKLPFNARTWAKELMGYRNDVSHIGSKDMPVEEAERALDTMYRFTKCIDVEAAGEIYDIYIQIRNSAGTNGVRLPDGPVPIDITAQPLQHITIPKGGVKNLLELVGTDIVQRTTLTRKVTFEGKTQAYPVYKVRLDALYYNDQNDRIATWITRYRAENGDEALGQLSGNEYNDVIEDFIYKSNSAAIDKTQKNITVVGQIEPGVTLTDGRIVDGNRRYTCLRRMAREDNQPVYFETVIMDVDIQSDKKQIKLLELAIQHGEEKKVDYDLIDYAIGTYMDVERTKLLTIAEYAESTKEKKSEIIKRIEIAQIICEFLEYVKLPEQFHVARELQVYSIFQEMMPSIKAMNTYNATRLKNVVFNNILMKALVDQRKFIRDIKLLIKNETHYLYFDDQELINNQIHELFDDYEVQGKEDLIRFASQNEQLTDELRAIHEKALLRSRKQQLKSIPVENLAKSYSLISDIDVHTLMNMSDDEKESLRRDIDRLIDLLEYHRTIVTDSME